MIRKKKKKKSIIYRKALEYWYNRAESIQKNENKAMVLIFKTAHVTETKRGKIASTLKQ